MIDLLVVEEVGAEEHLRVLADDDRLECLRGGCRVRFRNRQSDSFRELRSPISYVSTLYFGQDLLREKNQHGVVEPTLGLSHRSKTIFEWNCEKSFQQLMQFIFMMEELR